MNIKGDNSVSWLFGRYYLWRVNNQGAFEATQITQDEVEAMEASA